MTNSNAFSLTMRYIRHLIRSSVLILVARLSFKAQIKINRRSCVPPARKTFATNARSHGMKVSLVSKQ
jgi:hypothetical protein